MPLAKVEVALVEVMLRAGAWMPPVKVEVAEEVCQRVPTEAKVEVELAKMLRPVYVFSFARSVELAAVIVMLSPLENDVPFTVPKVPEMFPVPMVVVEVTRPFASVERMACGRLVMWRLVVVAFVNTLPPVQLLVFARSVELAAVTVMESPRLNVVPFTVPREPVM
jgi:hypothetical protein